VRVVYDAINKFRWPLILPIHISTRNNLLLAACGWV